MDYILKKFKQNLECFPGMQRQLKMDILSDNLGK